MTPENREAIPQRTERCWYCQQEVTDWVEPDWGAGRVCRKCETKHGPYDREAILGALSSAVTGDASVSMMIRRDLEEGRFRQINMSLTEGECSYSREWTSEIGWIEDESVSFSSLDELLEVLEWLKTGK